VRGVFAALVASKQDDKALGAKREKTLDDIVASFDRLAYVKTSADLFGIEDARHIVNAPKGTFAADLVALAKEVGLSVETTPIRDVFRKKYGMQAGNIVGSGSFVPTYTPTDHDTGQSDNVTPFWMVGATGAEVEVDTETGRVTVARLVNVCDVGRPINPDIVESQISGAAVMQLGFTMSEKMEFSAGQCVNPSLADYKIPGMLDIPAMENEAVDAAQASGPFGAKGVGESGTFGVSPAIANAIEDAVGVRLTSLPLTAEAVFRALREKAGKPLPAK
jgi:CO/xanthine dehydrogenase Mo-binding subunit